MPRSFGNDIVITKQDAIDAWDVLEEPSVSALSSKLRISHDRAYWLMDAYGLESIERGEVIKEMDRHEFWYFMRKLTRTIDENRWDRFTRHRQGDLPMSILQEACRRREEAR